MARIYDLGPLSERSPERSQAYAQLRILKETLRYAKREQLRSILHVVKRLNKRYFKGWVGGVRSARREKS